MPGDLQVQLQQAQQQNQTLARILAERCEQAAVHVEHQHQLQGVWHQLIRQQALPPSGTVQVSQTCLGYVLVGRKPNMSLVCFLLAESQTSFICFLLVESQTCLCSRFLLAEGRYNFLEMGLCPRGNSIGNSMAFVGCGYGNIISLCIIAVIHYRYHHLHV